MRATPQLLTPPAGEPVTLAEAKRWCRVDEGDRSQDAELLGCIGAAREYAEEYTGRRIVSAKWRNTFEGWPCGMVILPSECPLQGVSALRYVAVDGTQTTLATTEYQVDATRRQGRVTPAYLATWPATRSGVYNAVEIDFWAGFGPATETTTGFEAGSRTVTPTSMNGIYAGTALRVGEGETEETVVVASVTSTTFTATFLNGHPDPVAIRPALPMKLWKALRMLVVQGFDARGGGISADEARADTAIDNLLSSAWSGMYA